MKSMNRREGKKIAVMAAVMVGFMVIAFMPAASAGVTSFAVTPSTGLAGAVDSYNVLVTTTGVNTLNISIPAGFIAVPPANGGVEIARVDFWNTSTRDYYGYGTVTANNANPAGKVDVYCKMQVGGEEVIFTRTENVKYAPGGFTTLVVEYPEITPIGTATVNLTLPTEDDNGSINITIDCFSLDLLEDVHIAVRQFVRNPMIAGDYVFTAEGVTDTVIITAQKGCGAVFRNGWWYADTNGDHNTDVYLMYGITGDKAVVGDIDNNGINDMVAFRNGWWYVSKENHTGTNWTKSFKWGLKGDKPVIGDIDNNGIDDAVVFRDGWWYVSKEDHTGTDWTKSFKWGLTGDKPVIGDIDNNGVVDVVIFRDGWWYVCKQDHSGTDWTKSFKWGLTGDKPILDDIRNDGSIDTAILRNGYWWVSKMDHSGTDYGFKYGILGDDPIQGRFG
jgi:hypothetical protein